MKAFSLLLALAVTLLGTRTYAAAIVRQPTQPSMAQWLGL